MSSTSLKWNNCSYRWSKLTSTLSSNRALPGARMVHWTLSLCVSISPLLCLHERLGYSIKLKYSVREVDISNLTASLKSFPYSILYTMYFTLMFSPFDFLFLVLFYFNNCRSFSLYHLAGEQTMEISLFSNWLHLHFSKCLLMHN